MNLEPERIIRASRLEDGDFDSVDHPHLNVWLQSKSGHSRVSVGYTGKLPVTLRSCRGYRVVHDYRQERTMNYIVFEETEANLRKSFATVMTSAWDQSLQHDSADGSLRAFLVVVRDMKQLFGMKKSGFTPDALRGLVAELLTIRLLLEQGSSPYQVINGWKAPNGSVRDFVFSASHSLEVKSARPDSGTIIVSNIAQLDQEEAGLQLAVWPLTEVEAGSDGAVNVEMLLSELRARCSSDERAMDALEERVAVLGLNELDEDAMATAYSAGGCLTFNVIDNFPRIRASDISSQIREVSYSLRTADLSAFIDDLMIP